MATRTITGLEGSLARANFSGFASLAGAPTRITSSATFASKSTSTMVKTLISMAKSGFSAKSATNGYIPSAR